MLERGSLSPTQNAHVRVSTKSIVTGWRVRGWAADNAHVRVTVSTKSIVTRGWAGGRRCALRSLNSISIVYRPTVLYSRIVYRVQLYRPHKMERDRAPEDVTRTPLIAMSSPCPDILN